MGYFGCSVVFCSVALLLPAGALSEAAVAERLPAGSGRAIPCASAEACPLPILVAWRMRGGL